MICNEISYFTFQPGSSNPAAAAAAAEKLADVVRGECPERSYSHMIRYRLSGQAAAGAIDRYFIALEGNDYAARLWHGWGNHPDAIGNFGNFATREDLQGRGIGRKLLEMWFEDISNHPAPPLGLFCTSKMHLLDLYRRYGFRSAMSDVNDPTPLYKPCGSKAETFQEFCEEYYTAGDVALRPGTVGDRHEIDCLLKFHLRDRKKLAEFADLPTFEQAFLDHKFRGAPVPETAVTGSGRIVGWCYTDNSGKKTLQLHPNYKKDDLL